MPTNLPTIWWMAMAFAGEALVAAGALAAFGADAHGTDIALKLTARFSFGLFWLAYAGGGLALLLRPRWQALARHGRRFGLAFAAAHLVHLALIGWLCWLGAAPPRGVFVFFGVAVAWILLLVLSSISRVQRLLSQTAWWWLRLAGMNYVAYAFAVDFLAYPRSFQPVFLLFYLPFSVLIVVGAAAYWASLAVSLGEKWRRAPS
jgi:hypothetical protein